MLAQRGWPHLEHFFENAKIGAASPNAPNAPWCIFSALKFCANAQMHHRNFIQSRSYVQNLPKCPKCTRCIFISDDFAWKCPNAPFDLPKHLMFKNMPKCTECTMMHFFRWHISVQMHLCTTADLWCSIQKSEMCPNAQNAPGAFLFQTILCVNAQMHPKICAENGVKNMPKCTKCTRCIFHRPRQPAQMHPVFPPTNIDVCSRHTEPGLNTNINKFIRSIF